jgi:endonuclease/exonuclease/phosphatase family metal-dependent hydrolase
MKMIVKLIIVCILCIAAAAILYFVGVLIYGSLREFKPQTMEKLPIKSVNSNVIPIHKNLSLLTWNLGYGGLGKEMDFFYEGGKMVRPEEFLCQKYIRGIVDAIAANDSVDFFLFQEVDFNSRRSYYQDQAEIIAAAISDFNYFSAINYKTDYIPVPYLNPMGKVNSGLMILSKYNPFECFRISMPLTYSWPKRLFMPKRCILISKFGLESGKKLILLNIHNSAYDDADALRDEELKLIRVHAIEEYQKGNCVIIGGDWNQNPPRWEMTGSNDYKAKPLRPIPADLMPEGWTWAFDSSLPTNRDVDKPYDKATTNCSMIDFFLVSPNVEVIEIRTLDLEFENSDHNPMILKIRLKV